MTLLADDLVPSRTRAERGTGGETSAASRPTRLTGQLWAGRLALEPIDLTDVAVRDDVRSLVPRALAEQCNLLPLTLDGSTLWVAVSNPFDLAGVDVLTQVTGRDVQVHLATVEEIILARDRIYGSDLLAQNTAAQLPAESAPGIRAGDGAVREDLSRDDSDETVIKQVHELLRDAVRRRASDIHVEPWERRVRVRFRIDGVLWEAESLPKRSQLAVVSRLKIMANINIAEKRLPQDGRIQIRLEGRALDLRVSSLPSTHGESIVMRILDQDALSFGIAELGLHRDQQSLVEQLVAAPNGLMLVTGPTGSGKTSTLYSCLHHLNRSDRKIITVEDPVEYQISGINQVPVRHEIGMTFGSALRAMLRQAPNTIMVGEIRDGETAEIALNASLTGHMVFSTLHTNDATGAVARLIDMGIKPFLLSAALRGVLAQRLVRRICPECSQPFVPSAADARLLGLGQEDLATGTFRRGRGCAACGGTGYRGRTGIFELLVINEEISQMIHDRAGSARLRAQARQRGLRTLREDGARKVIAGLTTIEEVVSITVGDAC